MAAVTSGTFNLVKITKVEYGEADLSAGATPGSLFTMGTIKSGKLNLDFPNSQQPPNIRNRRNNRIESVVHRL